MAEYHYRYDPPPGGPGRAPDPNHDSDNSDLGSWIAIVACFMFGLWPIGVFLLFRKLMSTSTTTRSGSSQQTRRTSQTGAGCNYTYTYNPNQSRRAAPSPSASRPAAGTSSAPRTPSASADLWRAKPVKASAGRGLLTLGGILTSIFGFSLAVCLSVAITTGSLGGFLIPFTVLSSFTGAGLVLLYVGFFRRKQARMFLKYLALIGRNRSVSISTLAKATRRSYKKVCDELQDMLDYNILPTGYLDLANDRLVISAQGISDEPAQARQAQPQAKKQDENDILSEIRAVNDAIPDPVMSAKIDRIGEITGKILDYQAKNPAKAGQLRSFLNYYLPTTLKILRSYAQLDRQGIEGENISAAKARIEGMMDKVVEGFEKQLDKLFQDDAMDITSDVAVLEKMLDNDGLGSQGMTLGG